MVVVPLGPATRTHSASGKRKPIAATPAADPHLDHVGTTFGPLIINHEEPTPTNATALSNHVHVREGKERDTRRERKRKMPRAQIRCWFSSMQQLFSEAIAVDPQFVIVPLHGDAMLLAHCILSSQAQKLSSAIPSRIKDAYMHARICVVFGDDRFEDLEIIFVM
uniref:Uncharacterized protein n=1 Tax=Oryza rufipogon TaxID=4529 RepID=A0A0E0PFJ1_ORYRU